jgi:hypothetical protein
MFSDRNLAAPEASGFSHVLAFRNRTDEEAERQFASPAKVASRFSAAPGHRSRPAAGPEPSTDSLRSASKPGHRHLVVYSPVRARQDFEVRRRRLERSRERLIGLTRAGGQAAAGCQPDHRAGDPDPDPVQDYPLLQLRR